MTRPDPNPRPAARRGAVLRFVAWLKKMSLPPGGPLALALLSLALAEPWRTAGLSVSLSVLWLASTPWLGLLLLRRLEVHRPLDLEVASAMPGRAAVVVLDAGRYVRPGGVETVKPETLERLRHAARIHRATGAPILASGDGAGALMADVLRDDFGVETRWLETESRTTQENAERSAEVLSAEGFERILLVTHAWHMARATRAFRRTRLDVLPAPFGFAGPDRQELRLLMLVPSAGGLHSTAKALHEWIGIAWYEVRYGGARRR